MTEADASQTGKGYINKLKAATYCTRLAIVTQRMAAGVGSTQESFDDALIRGELFISFDNIRGRSDMPFFESFLTEDTYSARTPYRQPVCIDPRPVTVMLTSNRAEVTRDLANRSSCVQILRHPDGHVFAAYPGGDLSTMSAPISRNI